MILSVLLDDSQLIERCRIFIIKLFWFVSARLKVNKDKRWVFIPTMNFIKNDFCSE